MDNEYAVNRSSLDKRIGCIDVTTLVGIANTILFAYVRKLQLVDLQSTPLEYQG